MHSSREEYRCDNFLVEELQEAREKEERLIKGFKQSSEFINRAHERAYESLRDSMRWRPEQLDTGLLCREHWGDEDLNRGVLHSDAVSRHRMLAVPVPTQYENQPLELEIDSPQADVESD